MRRIPSHHKEHFNRAQQFIDYHHEQGRTKKEIMQRLRQAGWKHAHINKLKYRSPAHVERKKMIGIGVASVVFLALFVGIFYNTVTDGLTGQAIDLGVGNDDALQNNNLIDANAQNVNQNKYIPPQFESSCHDGKDEDEDGLTDCADADCKLAEICSFDFGSCNGISNEYCTSVPGCYWKKGKKGYKKGGRWVPPQPSKCSGTPTGCADLSNVPEDAVAEDLDLDVCRGDCEFNIIQSRFGVEGYSCTKPTSKPVLCFDGKDNNANNFVDGEDAACREAQCSNDDTKQWVWSYVPGDQKGTIPPKSNGKQRIACCTEKQCATLEGGCANIDTIDPLTNTVCSEGNDWEDRCISHSQCGVIEYCSVQEECVEGKIAHYSFNGNAKDSTPNKFDGTVIGNLDCSIDGVKGKACTFAGKTDTYVKLPHSILHNKNTFSILFWVKSTGTQDGMISIANDDNDNQFLLFSQENLWLGRWVTNQNKNDISTNIKVNDGSWHHIALTWDKGTASITVDGKHQDKWSSQNGYFPSDTLTIHPNGFIIGQEQDKVEKDFDVTQSFEGAIDELQFYSYVVGFEKINEIYAAEKPQEEEQPAQNNQQCDDAACQNGHVCAKDNQCSADGDSDGVADTDEPVACKNTPQNKKDLTTSNGCLGGDVPIGGSYDGCVNGDDIDVIVQHINLECQPNTQVATKDLSHGDANGDGCVNGDDIEVIVQNIDLECGN